ncbi:pyrroline-5-carboxylate reductase [Eubacterium oxidoreducens]|uniref:Pyrroline-5-carboxylate reductase n=1 Tax=Eubacterium oxidoreducens TaxID=1732 RepID=A0A1G6BAV6_EUBOX|nr:pyrroline-5-carboxylate reductase [Eubacterium oxidoreducens]SDB17736.1 pyrroline-5-carboxylate reductase [Eubacterium oxidoreducens]
MSNIKIGFIGSGNMGSAMIGGIIQSKLVDADHVMVSDPMEDKLASIKERFSIKTTTDNKEVATFADYLFLAVKPNIIRDVISQIKDVITNDKVIISIAAGTPIAAIEEAFGKTVNLIRVMPNTPALVGEAMSALSPNEEINDEQISFACKVFNSFGKCEVVKESLMDAVVGISGSSPAYVYMFIEAMADAAVCDGMPRAQAYKFAAQSVYGAAKMVLETGEHPGVLKDAVCSPAGTTIKAVAKLEEKGFRDAVISAQLACSEMSREMSKKK